MLKWVVIRAPWSEQIEWGTERGSGFCEWLPWEASSTSLMVNYYGTRTPTKGNSSRELSLLKCFDAFEGSSSIEEGYHFLDST
ncbi:hypothetical protein TIFTF001_001386 [Ficus carica]|uniref:Uncharacterized protein n=1 Tax=Ficus carica TaxID=3494 RepID=A0AA87ZFS6_FICCA|nr:hypothetical protein TIFTF001_001386 [Ficus carica]